MQILDGKLLSLKIKNNIKKEILKLNTPPHLVVIQIGSNEASTIYVKAKKKDALEVGMNFSHYHFQDNTKEEVIIAKINELNQNTTVHGIIVQLPLPLNFNSSKIINTIDEKKDVDGLTWINCGKLSAGEPFIIPCTPKGIIRLLKEYKVNLVGQNVVIIGRSSLVGKPLVQIFLQEDSTVTICHSKTKDLANLTKKADIVVSAVGIKNLVTKAMLKKEVIIVDVAINRFNKNICGDVDFDNVAPITKLITPVPGGVGPMTRAMLLENTLECYLRLIENEQPQ